MDLKMSLLSILLTINLFVSCTSPEVIPDECLDCFDPNGDTELTQFLQRDSQICSEDITETETDDDKNKSERLVVDSFTIRSYVKLRYATTYVTKSITNRFKRNQNAEFLTYIPIKAYITSFIVEIDGKVYKSKISKRSLGVKQDEKEAEEQGNDLRKFNIVTKLKPNSTVVYYLLYEELLQRQYSQYELNLNINPGQITRNLDVEISINDYKAIQNVQIPVLMSPNDEVETNNKQLQPKVRIDYKSPNSVLIRFHPTVEQQKKFIRAFGTNAKDGLKTQFRVNYDVKRNENGGELITHGSYFVHYFAPQRLKALPKHVIFVLDVSDSMEGKRIAQLKKAMVEIMEQLKPHDVFSIIQFETTVSIADIKHKKQFKEIIHDGFAGDYERIEKILRRIPIPEAVKAEKSNINKAIEIVNNLRSGGSTNIIGGLQLALLVVKRTRAIHKNKYESIIMFLTDGEPNTGVAEEDKIIEIVTKFNRNSASIFSIGIGDGANFAFLKRLSSLNKGTSLLIKHDADISRLLKQFFDEYSTPVLRDIRFDYGTNLTITKTYFPTYFDGAGLIVAGKFDKPTLSPRITAKTQNGTVEFQPDIIRSSTSLERLWSYLTIYQNLDALENRGITISQLSYTMNLALKYGYVTPLTSLKLVIPGSKPIYDDSILTPPYKPVKDLRKVSVTIDQKEIQHRVLPVEIAKAPHSEAVEKLSETIKNAFIKILLNSFNKVL